MSPSTELSTTGLASLLVDLVYGGQSVSDVARSAGMTRPQLVELLGQPKVARQLQSLLVDRNRLAVLEPIANLVVRQQRRQSLYESAIAAGELDLARKILQDAGREMSAGSDVVPQTGIIVNIVPATASSSTPGATPVPAVSVQVEQHAISRQDSAHAGERSAD